MIMWQTVMIHQERLAVGDKRADSFMYFMSSQTSIWHCAIHVSQLLREF